MRNRHYYTHRPSAPQYGAAWPQLLADARSIIERVRRLGVVIAGPEGFRRPVLDPGAGIYLNGDATTDLDGDVLRLLPPTVPPAHPGTDLVETSVRTGAKPYDLAVTAILLRAFQLAPHAVALGSDNDFDRDWARARATLVVLFNTRTTANPFTITATTADRWDAQL